jgi:hypothetical protein
MPLSALLAVALFLSHTPEETSDAATFESLKTMSGVWRQTGTQRPMTITYRVISGESAVVETWTTASGRETMTVYVMDGERLIATHYCAQDNQPTLALTASTPELVFDFRSATGLTDPAASHQHRFTIRPIDADHMERSETYVESGISETTTLALTRQR